MRFVMNAISRYFNNIYSIAVITGLIILVSGCGQVRYDNTTDVYSVGAYESNQSQRVTRTSSGPHENVTARYASSSDEREKKYSDHNRGKQYAIGQNDGATANYGHSKDPNATTYGDNNSGRKYSIGQYDKATAHYTLKQGSGKRQAPQQHVNQAEHTPVRREMNNTMILDITDVLFEFDKSVIRTQYYPALNEWVKFFQDNPQVFAEIHGHADSTGPSDYNQRLSERRADAVVKYLTRNGVDASQLIPLGFGESRPLVPNTSKEGQQKNRRVELNY